MTLIPPKHLFISFSPRIVQSQSLLNSTALLLLCIILDMLEYNWGHILCTYRSCVICAPLGRVSANEYRPTVSTDTRPRGAQITQDPYLLTEWEGWTVNYYNSVNKGWFSVASESES